MSIKTATGTGLGYFFILRRDIDCGIVLIVTSVDFPECVSLRQVIINLT